LAFLRKRTGRIEEEMMKTGDDHMNARTMWVRRAILALASTLAAGALCGCPSQVPVAAPQPTPTICLGMTPPTSESLIQACACKPNPQDISNNGPALQGAGLSCSDFTLPADNNQVPYGRADATVFSLLGMVTKDCGAIESVKVGHGALNGTLAGAAVTSWVGVQMRGQLSCADGNGKTADVYARIFDVKPDPTDDAPAPLLNGVDSTTMRYDVRIVDPTGAHAPVPVCRSTDGGVSYNETDPHNWPIPVANVWDSSGARPQGALTGFTFACPDGAVQKCYRKLGYREWDSDAKRSPALMASLQAACTRMERADYNHNGDPHTKEGTCIDVADDGKIHAFATQQPASCAGDLSPESVWTENGPLCLSHLRWTIVNTINFTVQGPHYVDLSSFVGCGDDMLNKCNDPQGVMTQGIVCDRSAVPPSP
jgi:ADYC domain